MNAFFVAFALSILTSQPVQAEELFDADTGLRIAFYRSPTPTSVPHGTVIDSDELGQMIDRGALLLDVLPAPGFTLTENGDWILPEIHQSLPGAIWLPETGRGKLTPQIADYLDHSLGICAAGRPIVVFCRSDCWMSWNAVQHIADLGYEQLYWFRDGIEGWADMGHDLAPAKALPIGATSCSPT